MRKLVAFFLSIIVFLHCGFTCFALEGSNELQKGYIVVEFSDANGKNEYLNVAIQGNNIFVDAEQLAKRLGYALKITDEFVQIYNPYIFGNEEYGIESFYENEQPFCLLRYNYSDTSVISFPKGTYTSPFIPIKEGNTAWIPLEYSLLLLNSNMLIADDVLLITMPEKDIIDWILSTCRRESLSFDWAQDIGYDDFRYSAISGVSHMINVFNGALMFDGASWATLFTQFAGSSSPYDYKYGNDFANLLVSTSDKELKEMIENTKKLNAVFSPTGKVGKLLSKVTVSDEEIGVLNKLCSQYLQSFREGNNTSLLMYNRTYQQLENALENDTWYSDLAYEIMNVQNKLGDVTTILDYSIKAAEVVGYLSEFSNQDSFSIEAAKQFLSEADASYFPNGTLQAVQNRISMMETNMIEYSIYRFIEENYEKWINDGLGISEALGSQANIALIAWNLASDFVPFVSNGLDSADKMELALYSQLFQYTSRMNFSEHLSKDFIDKQYNSSIDVNSLFQLANSCYIYLKSCYITRDSALGSLGNVSEEKKKWVVDEQNKVNDDIAKCLAILKTANKDNAYYVYGFLPSDNIFYNANYDGSKLAHLFLTEKPNIPASDIKREKGVHSAMSDERDIVLVLDTSGSMSGMPMTETKKASVNFIDTILEEDASIGVVTYDNSASLVSEFSVNKDSLEKVISDIYVGGGTNIEAGLKKAYSMLSTSNAKRKIIVLMSDGEPNDGKGGNDLISYADEIKKDGVLIYTLGFFESLGDYKTSAQQLMERIASDGCHYEVANADDLIFFFGDIADQLNGQKYIYIRIACPVDVAVTYNGETLCSAEDALNLRTDFGTLTFEENESVSDGDENDKIKVLRLKEGADYDVQIVGTGHGIMNYTIGFMDENGDYSDFRRFEDIKITRRTKIDTVAAVSKESVLNIDENGDGKYDLKIRAEENEIGEEVKEFDMDYIIVGGGVLLLLLFLIVIIREIKKGKEHN